MFLQVALGVLLSTAVTARAEVDEGGRPVAEDETPDEYYERRPAFDKSFPCLGDLLTDRRPPPSARGPVRQPAIDPAPAAAPAAYDPRQYRMEQEASDPPVASEPHTEKGSPWAPPPKAPAAEITKGTKL